MTVNVFGGFSSAICICFGISNGSGILYDLKILLYLLADDWRARVFKLTGISQRNVSESRRQGSLLTKNIGCFEFLYVLS